MKKLFFLLCIGLFLINTQSWAAGPATIDYETVGQDWTWTVFANGATQSPADFAVIPNPQTGGINTSAHCASLLVHADAARWAGVITLNIGTFTFDATNCIVKMLVHKDVASKFQLEFKVNGDAEEADAVQVTNTTINEWEELTFDFTAYIGNTYATMEIIPDFAAGARNYGSTNYWDRIAFGSGGSVTPPGPTGLIDFETVGNAWTWKPFSGGVFSVVTNPLITGINTSAHCANLVVPADAARWAGVYTANIPSTTLDATNCMIKVMVYKDVVSNFQLGFKANPDDEDADVVQVSNTITTGWEELTFDFSAFIGKTYVHMEFIPDFAEGARSYASNNYLDNVRFGTGTVTPPQPTGNIDFETVGNNWSWSAFSGGTFSVASNPLSAGINTSAHVAKLVVNADAARWAGANSISFPSTKLDATNCIIKVMVYKDVVSNFKLGFKVSSDDEDTDGFEVSNASTTGWEELTFDFTDYIGKTYSYIEFIPDFAADARTYGSINYWDNITFGSGSSGFSTNQIQSLEIYPNPLNKVLNIKTDAEVTKVIINNLAGQTTKRFLSTNSQRSFDVSDLSAGTYVVTLEMKDGRHLTQKVVKL